MIKTKYGGVDVWPPGTPVCLNNDGKTHYQHFCNPDLYKPQIVSITNYPEVLHNHCVPCVRSEGGWMPADKRYWSYHFSNEFLYEPID